MFFKLDFYLQIFYYMKYIRNKSIMLATSNIHVFKAIQLIPTGNPVLGKFVNNLGNS